MNKFLTALLCLPGYPAFAQSVEPNEDGFSIDLSSPDLQPDLSGLGIESLSADWTNADGTAPQLYATQSSGNRTPCVFINPPGLWWCSGGPGGVLIVVSPEIGSSMDPEPFSEDWVEQYAINSPSLTTLGNDTVIMTFE